MFGKLGSVYRLCRYQKALLFPQHNLIRRGMRGKDEQQLDVFSYVNSACRRTIRYVHCVS